MKNKALLSGLIASLITLGCLAIFYPPTTFHAIVSIEAAIEAQNLAIDFTFDGQPTKQDCENRTGRVAQSLLKNCAHCRVTKLSCEAVLTEQQISLLANTPIAMVTGSMRDGVVSFGASSPEIALAVCQESEKQASRLDQPVICFEAGVPRVKPSVQTTFQPWYLALALVTFFASWCTCWLIRRFEHLHAHYTHDQVGAGPQKFHAVPTPRIGGVSILIALVAGSIGLMVYPGTIGFSVAQSFVLLAVAVPAFLFGIIEDLTRRVGVLERLLGTMISGAAAAWLLGSVLHHLDVPFVDTALSWRPLAIAFTVFAVAGIANSINIIDGYNGLAAGFAAIVFAALALVAGLVGDELVLVTAIIMVAALVGFLFWNWPMGKVFMGDGGAYLVGFLLAQLSVLLVVRNPTVSPWLPVLLLAHPIVETLFSIYRRKMIRRQSPGKPDALHLHQLIFSRLVRHHVGTQNPHLKTLRNARVAPYFWAIAAVCALPSLIWWHDTATLVICVGVFSIAYVGFYRSLATWRTPVSMISKPNVSE